MTCEPYCGCAHRHLPPRVLRPSLPDDRNAHRDDEVWSIHPANLRRRYPRSVHATGWTSPREARKGATHLVNCSHICAKIDKYPQNCLVLCQVKRSFPILFRECRQLQSPRRQGKRQGTHLILSVDVCTHIDQVSHERLQIPPHCFVQSCVSTLPAHVSLTPNFGWERGIVCDSRDCSRLSERKQARQLTLSVVSGKTPFASSFRTTST